MMFVLSIIYLIFNIIVCNRKLNNSFQLVRKLVNIPQPMAFEMIDKFRCVVLCNRELRIYDLNTGELVNKLKGQYHFLVF